MYEIREILRVPSIIIIHLYNNRAIVGNVASSLSLSYSYVVNILIVLQKNGYVITEKVGRSRFCYLSKKGNKIAESLLLVSNQLNDRRK